MHCTQCSRVHTSVTVHCVHYESKQWYCTVYTWVKVVVLHTVSQSSGSVHCVHCESKQWYCTLCTLWVNAVVLHTVYTMSQCSGTAHCVHCESKQWYCTLCTLWVKAVALHTVSQNTGTVQKMQKQFTLLATTEGRNPDGFWIEPSPPTASLYWVHKSTNHKFWIVCLHSLLLFSLGLFQIHRGGVKTILVVCTG